MYNRFSEYRVMWVMVFFDLPTETRKERKAASEFRKQLVTDRYNMFPSVENAEVHIKRVKRNLPEYGYVGILCITDKQFGQMELFVGSKPESLNPPVQQLELF